MTLSEAIALWFREAPPASPDFRTIRIAHHEGGEIQGRLATWAWDPAQRVRRAFRVSFKRLFPIVILLLPFAFLEPFFFLIWGSVVYGAILFVIGPYLFARYSAEESSFFYAEAQCPHCKAEGRLNPFWKTELKDPIVLLCPQCGQTCQGYQN